MPSRDVYGFFFPEKQIIANIMSDHFTTIDLYIGKQSIFYIWYENGICFVGDITDQHGTFLSKECLATKYNIAINHPNY